MVTISLFPLRISFQDRLAFMCDQKRRSKQERADRKRIALQWYSEGVSVTEIGRRLGVTQSSVSHMLRKLGVPPSTEKRESRAAIITPELKSRLIELANQQWTAKTISDELGINYNLVRNILKTSGFSLKPFGTGKGRHGGAKVDVETVMMLHRKGLSIPDIAKQVQASTDIVRRRMKWGGVKSEKIGEKDILPLLKAGLTARQCAKALAVSVATVKRYAKLAGFDLCRKTLRSQVADDILVLRRQGMSCNEIAKAVGVDHSYVWRILKEDAPELARVSDRSKFLIGKVGRKRLVDVEKAKVMLVDGKLPQEIADAFGCSPFTVRRQLKEAQVKLPAQNRASRSKQMLDIILQEDLSLEEAMARFKCGASNIRNIAKKHGYGFRRGKPVPVAALEAMRTENLLKAQAKRNMEILPKAPVEELPDSTEWLQHIQNMKYFVGSDSDYCRRNGLKLETFRKYKKKYGIRLRNSRRTPESRRKGS